MPPSLKSLFTSFTSLLPLTNHQHPLSHDAAAAAAWKGEVTPYEPLSGAPSCPVDGPTSCSNPGSGTDSCCFVAPSGRILLTQFWDDTVHAGGSEEDWTVHGLWPDLCDGSYKAFCGMTPHFNNITDILRHYGQADLLASMERYWVAAYGTNNHLWAHEYNKHASCINTLATRCYGESYDAGVEVVDYFTRAFALFKQLDTFTALERAGIVPSREKTYPIKDVTKTLERLSGGKVVLRCSGRKRDVLHEAWYSYFLKGSLQTGQFVPASELGEHGDANNCADSVRYVPKRCKGNCPPSSYEDL
ncbi:hypothetical protein K4K53_001091 [Colletotrichum sp. SAR 10_77]|nr:hypothetical protein K4K53_001091 [Colletotrichum sp. SAR 10_77]